MMKTIEMDVHIALAIAEASMSKLPPKTKYAVKQAQSKLTDAASSPPRRKYSNNINNTSIGKMAKSQFITSKDMIIT